MRLSRNQIISVAAFCLTLLCVVLWSLFAEYDRPWKKYQREFRDIEYDITAKHYQKLLLEKQGTLADTQRAGELAKALAITKGRIDNIPARGEKIKQLWLQDLGITDRCITCHQGADKKELAGYPQPFTAHSGDYLKDHPVKKYGCVVCHEGNGAALSEEAAHGEEKNWTKPLLRGPFAQSSCGKCHYQDQQLPLNVNLKGAPKYIYGWKLFNEYNCIGCHKLTGYERPERIAPALNAIGRKVSKAWLAAWLKNPKDYLPETRMPRYNLGDEEVGYVSDYLMSLNAPDVLRNPPSPPFAKGWDLESPPLAKGDIGGFFDNASIIDGEISFIALGCNGCHLIDGKGTAFGPDLSDIGNKVKPDWLYQFLKDPRSYDPDTIIPDFKVPEKEIPGMAAYLMSFKNDENNSVGRSFIKVTTELSSDVDNGRQLVNKLGCTGCHKIENLPQGYDAPELDGIGSKRIDELFFNNINGVEKTLINWMKIKLMEPGRFSTDNIVTRMPDYNFNEEQSEALAVFLLSIRNDSIPAKYQRKLIDRETAEMRGQRIIEKYNCLGCHRINREGAEIGPDLTGEAKKSRPEWLFNFLKQPHKIRPAPVLKAGMPDFNLSDEEVIIVIEYLANVSGESFPYNADMKKSISMEDVRDGEKLYVEIFACVSCHIVEGAGGEVGPEHTDLASRLRRQWIEQWLRNPQAIKPDVRMPRFKFKDWEFEALTNYLMTLGQYRFLQSKNDNL